MCSTWAPQNGGISAPFPEWYLRRRDRGQNHATDHLWRLGARHLDMCSMASVIWLLSSFVGFEFLLVAGGCFVAFASIVTLAEELVEWHRYREASPVQRQLLPPAF